MRISASNNSHELDAANYPRRDYQYSITRKALFHNTLVSLPTGLGKTFIAAVGTSALPGYENPLIL
jgi:Fanconi anemia group M protein